MKTDILVVGAGFAGSVVAERLANMGMQVMVIDKRLHIGGNAYDEFDQYGILIHKYGPHIFHTNSDQIFNYLSRFTEWRRYEHRVLAKVDDKYLPIPINLDTVNRLYDLDLDEEGLKAYFEKVRVQVKEINTSEDVVLNTVGIDLYEKFFKGYTLKQWGVDPSKLSASVTARIPVRTNRDDRYFTDTIQVMPLHGYTKMFENILDHSNIRVELGVDYFSIKNRIDAKYIVYTGPIDDFFNFKFGKLPYRSLRFEHEHIPSINHYQPVGTVNYPNDFDFTRITEFNHLTGQVHNGTSIVREYPTAIGDPYYPVPAKTNEKIYQKYKEASRNEKNVSFVGRLAQYRYYNMDQVVGAALTVAKILMNNF